MVGGSLIFLKIKSNCLFGVKTTRLQARGRSRQAVPLVRRWSKHEVIIKASCLRFLPGLQLYPVGVKAHIAAASTSKLARICAGIQQHTCNCHSAKSQSCWEGEGEESNGKEKTDVCEATEPIKDFEGLQILLLLSSQSGHESQMTSCHFSLGLGSLLDT